MAGAAGGLLRTVSSAVTGGTVEMTAWGANDAEETELAVVRVGRRREFCHDSAAPRSPFSRCLNRDGEGGASRIMTELSQHGL